MIHVKRAHENVQRAKRTRRLVSSLNVKYLLRARVFLYIKIFSLSLSPNYAGKRTQVGDLRYYQERKRRRNPTLRKAGTQKRHGGESRGGRARAHRVIEFFFLS